MIGTSFYSIDGLNDTMTQASDKFKTWNEANKICYFPHQRRLRFFTSYLQDNCKRECAWNKWVARFKQNLFLHRIKIQEQYFWSSSSFAISKHLTFRCFAINNKTILAIFRHCVSYSDFLFMRPSLCSRRPCNLNCLINLGLWPFLNYHRRRIPNIISAFFATFQTQERMN